MEGQASPHPTPETLRAYALGLLDEVSAQIVHDHLEHCPDCRHQISEMAPDSFVGRLRHAAEGSGMPTIDRPVGANQEPEPPIAHGVTIDSSAGPCMSDTGPVDATSAAQNNPNASPLPAGTRVGYFGDYELQGVLGEGGMGIVYKARQLSLNRPVALKMIKSARFAGADEVRRFQNESEAVAWLDHPNIVPIFEVGELEDQHYFSMKLIAGESVDKRPGDYIAKVRHAAELMVISAGAVHHAHQRGILHRDLKPANILIDAEGRPHVTDFGLAKRVEGDSGLTQTGAILGTPAYMAPEQASGKRGTVTTATDVYGLGTVLYFLLTGKAPFGGVSVIDTLELVRERSPEPPTKRNRRVPRDLEVICLKCLEKDPRQRYASADALAEDLKHWLAGEPIVARPVGNAARLWLWCRRNPVVASATGLATAALAGVVILSLLSARQQAALAAAQKRFIEEQIHHGQELKASLAASKRRQAMLDFERGQACCEQGQIGLGLLWYVECLRAAADAQDPDWKNAASSNLVAWQRLQPRLTGVFDNGAAITRVALSRDGKSVLTGSEGSGARLWDALTGLPIGKPIEHQGSVEAVAFSPDGKTIATAGSDKTVRLWDAASGHPIGKPMEHDQDVHFVAFSPDGKTIVTGTRESARLWDAATALPLGRPIEHQGEDAFVAAVASSPDRKTIVIGSSDGKARLWDAVTGLPIGKIIEHQEGGVSAVAFSPEGKAVLTGGYYTARLWDAATGLPIGRPMKHDGSVSTVAFSPDGRMILTGTMTNPRNTYADYSDGNVDEDEEIELGWQDEHEASVWLWDAASGRLLAKPLEHQAGVDEVAFGRGGNSILVRNVDGMARLWNAAIGPQVGKPIEWDGQVDAVAFSPNGRTIVTGNADGTARLWDASAGRPVGRVMAHLAADVTSVAFSPDGKTVLTVSGMALLWDAATGRPIGKPIEQEGGIDTAVFTSDGKAVLTVGNDTARLWDTATGRPIDKTMEYQGGVSAIALSPDGKIVATAGLDHTARLWDAANGRPIGPAMEHRNAVEAVAFSPGGKTIVTGSSDSTARIWDAASGQPIGKAMRHYAGVGSVAFSPDGKAIASADSDGTVRLWDAATGEPIGPPLQHRVKFVIAGSQSDPHAVFDAPEESGGIAYYPKGSVAFSPDGKTVLTRGTDGEPPRLWETPTQLPDDPPRLAAWVQTLTGLELDEQGVPHMLGPVAWRNSRDLLLRLGGPPVADADHVLRPIPLGPRPTTRALASVERESWAEIDSTVRLQQGVFDYNIENEPCPGRILALSEAGAGGGLRRVVSDLLERFRETTMPWTANHVAWCCALAPDAVDEPEVPVRLAELALKGMPTEQKHLALNTLGAALYRAGRFEEAILRLQEAINSRNSADEPADWPFLAMAHHRLGHRDEARHWLHRFRSHPDVGWQIAALRSEAEAVILYDPVFPANPFAR